MESVPTLIPIFHNAGTRQIYYNKKVHFDPSVIPDHGGVGIDISVHEDVPKCQYLKSTDQAQFGAKCCALPFMPPNFVKTLHDPCLEALEQKKNNLADFCTSLVNLRNKINRFSTFKESVLSSKSRLQKLLSKQKFKKVSVPKSIFQLAKKYPSTTSIPMENYSFTGGSLTSFSSSQKSHVLLYSAGKKCSNLAFTCLEETHDDAKSYQPASSEANSIKLKGGRILQIVSESCGICYVRQRHYVHFVNLGDDWKSMHNDPCILSFKMQDEVSCISASPYIPTEFAVISETGLLSIQNVEKTKLIWQSDYYTHAVPSADAWWICSFGAHPRSVLYMDRNHLFSIDTRTKKSQECLLVSSSNDCLLPEEHLFHVQRLHTNYHQYLITTDTCLLVCDERYPKNVVMTWNHMMKSPPLYCKAITYNNLSDSSDVAVILGSQKSQEVSSFFLKSSCTQIQPVSLSSPLFLSSPTDCIQSLKLHGMSIDDSICKRLASPLIGVSAVSHPKKSGFTAFQLTSLGDLFYQDFYTCNGDSERTYRTDAGGVLCPPEKILPYLSQWLENTVITKKIKKEKINSATKSNKKKINSAKKSNKEKINSAKKSNKEKINSAKKSNKEKINSAKKSNKEKINSAKKSNKEKINSAKKSNKEKINSANKSKRKKIKAHKKKRKEIYAMKKQEIDTTHIDVDLSTIFDSSPEISVECMICNTTNIQPNKKLVELSVCPSCGLDTAYTKQLADAPNVLTVPQSSLAENVNTEDESPTWNLLEFFSFTDPMSRKILRPWLNRQDEDQEERTFMDDTSFSGDSSSMSFSNPATPINDSDVSLSSAAVESSFAEMNSSRVSAASDLSEHKKNIDADEDEFVPPSQEVRSLLRETLRTPKRTRLQTNKLKTTAGF